MKKLRYIFVTLLFTLSYGVLSAQIKFFEISHNFGEIAEDGGKVEHIFRFQNISDKPIVVLSATSSCGCTKTEFSRKPVLPGEESELKVVFNPMNYPGNVSRKVVIVTNEGTVKEPLLIEGRVLPRVRSIEERYPIQLGGGLRAATNAHSFGYVEHGKMIQSTFEVVNVSQKRISLTIENPYPELDFYLPTELAAGEEATINFGCALPENSTIYGSLAYSVWAVVDGKRAQYPFIINGLAIDAREENANNNAQMIAMSEKFIKFGAVKCDVVKRVRELELRNTGNSRLEIRKLELTGEGFVADIEGDSSIEAGGRRVVKVAIYPSRLPFGAVVERLRIISNDPKMPVLTIRVSAIVEE